MDRSLKFRPPEGSCKCDPDCACHQLQPLTKEQIEEIEESFDEEDEEATAVVETLDKTIKEMDKGIEAIKRQVMLSINPKAGVKKETGVIAVNPRTGVVVEVLPRKQPESVQTHASFCDCEFCKEMERKRLEKAFSTAETVYKEKEDGTWEKYSDLQPDATLANKDTPSEPFFRNPIDDSYPEKQQKTTIVQSGNTCAECGRTQEAVREWNKIQIVVEKKKWWRSFNLGFLSGAVVIALVIVVMVVLWVLTGVN